jgi:hypothetical protein
MTGRSRPLAMWATSTSSTLPRLAISCATRHGRGELMWVVRAWSWQGTGCAQHRCSARMLQLHGETFEGDWLARQAGGRRHATTSYGVQQQACGQHAGGLPAGGSWRARPGRAAAGSSQKPRARCRARRRAGRSSPAAQWCRCWAPPGARLRGTAGGGRGRGCSPGLMHGSHKHRRRAARPPPRTLATTQPAALRPPTHDYGQGRVVVQVHVLLQVVRPARRRQQRAHVVVECDLDIIHQRHILWWW